MNENDIARLRSPNFTPARRGYDMREVDHFLAAFADWLENTAPEEIGNAAVQRKLKLVGATTSQILLTTEREADQLRAEAEGEVAQLRADAEAYEAQLRSDAEAYAAQTRDEAEAYAARMTEEADREAHGAIADAEARAQRTIEEGEERRVAIEHVIGDLRAARDRALAQLEDLRKELRATIATHMPSGDDPFAIPAELDPAARQEAAREEATA